MRAMSIVQSREHGWHQKLPSEMMKGNGSPRVRQAAEKASKKKVVCKGGRGSFATDDGVSVPNGGQGRIAIGNGLCTAKDVVVKIIT